MTIPQFSSHDTRPVVLSLCDRTGNVLKPWARSGQYRCIAVDNCRESARIEGGIEYVAADVLRYLPPRAEYAFTCAFPPCTHLAVSGARWFTDKGLAALAGSLEIVERCREILEWTGAPWFLENPVSTLATYWRRPDYTFNPCDFGGYPGGSGDGYTKRTCLWVGEMFRMPDALPVEAVDGSRMHRIAPGPGRADARAETPMGFAEAIYQANAIREAMDAGK